MKKLYLKIWNGQVEIFKHMSFKNLHFNIWINLLLIERCIVCGWDMGKNNIGELFCTVLYHIAFSSNITVSVGIKINHRK